MLNQRQEKLLLLLKRFDYLTIKQFQELHDLKSNRNAYRVIKQLEPYVNVFKDNGINVYYLNKEGRDYVNSSKERTKITTARHYLLRNDLFIHSGKPHTWKNEIQMEYADNDKKIRVIADAHYTTIAYPQHKHHIIEVDNAQKMNKNKIKIEKYRRLIEKGVFKGMPILIWVTNTSYRKAMLSEMMDGLDYKILLPTDFY